MANSITLFKQTLSETLDEVYKVASLTSVLDGNDDMVKQGANANELIIPKMSVQGLADYSRENGYVSGDVTLTNETVQCNFDRGRMFTVDSMDDLETAGIAYGAASETADTAAPASVQAWKPIYTRLTFKSGCVGNGVREIQTGLNLLNCGLTVDGRFGPLTEQAVIRFQQAQGLEADGVVGAATWAALIAAANEQ